LGHHKLEAEKNGRVSDHKKHMDYLQRVSSQVQAIQMGMLTHTLQFQRDVVPYPNPNKTDEPKAVRFSFSHHQRGNVVAGSL